MVWVAVVWAVCVAVLVVWIAMAKEWDGDP